MAQFNFTLDEAIVKEVLLGEDRSSAQTMPLVRLSKIVTTMQ
jgi:hypothetical protein